MAWQAATLAGPLPCRQDPRLWFSETPADLERAKALCRTCPLRMPCLAGATERGEPHGVWGGEIFSQGVITAQKRPRGRPPKKPAGHLTCPHPPGACPKTHPAREVSR
ncbi:MAG: WhiB family transcriptional regulator [Streptosporangiaceae bacterium]